MKIRLICAALLIAGMGSAGCGAVPEPPLACTEGGFLWGGGGEFSFQFCQTLGMECNEAVTLADECPSFVDELEGYIIEVLVPMITEHLPFIPSFIDVDELVGMLFDQYVGVCGEEFLDQIATCQPLGGEGDPCAEDNDCLGDLACVEGICAIPEEPGCVEDSDCLGDLVCVEGVCVTPEEPECVEDSDCLGDLVCVEGMCVVFEDGSCEEDLDCPEDLVCVEETCVVAPPAD